MVTIDEFKKKIKSCPIETTFKHIGKKWTINIIRDLFLGKKRFKEFLESNAGMSPKMLSLRLRELEKDHIIAKKIKNKYPLKIEYELTQKGESLRHIIYEAILFSMKNCSNEIFKDEIFDDKTYQLVAKEFFNING